MQLCQALQRKNCVCVPQDSAPRAGGGAGDRGVCTEPALVCAQPSPHRASWSRSWAGIRLLPGPGGEEPACLMPALAHETSQPLGNTTRRRVYDF